MRQQFDSIDQSNPPAENRQEALQGAGEIKTTFRAD
jgi:hypothetical protein